MNTKQLKTVILFGAGASAFSEPSGVPVPPVGLRLFDCLAEQGGVAASVNGPMRDAFRQNFERGMALFYQQREHDTSALLREMAIYFSQFYATEESCYRRLVPYLSWRPVGVF